MANQHGEFIWYELLANDADAAQSFYKAVIGWDIDPSQSKEVDYRIFHAIDGDTAERHPIGGLMQLTPEMKAGGAQAVWLGYIAVEDVDQSIADITAAGGSVHLPAFDMPDVGRLAMVADPQGAPFYLMRSVHDNTSLAFASDKPRNGHCAWNELATADPASAKDFYFNAFGWSKDGEMDMGAMGAYEFIRHNGVIGAIMPKPEEMPVTAWSYYFRVADIDTAHKLITDNGGQVLFGPDAIPGDEFIIKGIDPQGAVFSIVGARTAS